MTADREAKSPPAPTQPGPARQGLSTEQRLRLGGWAKWFDTPRGFPVDEELVQEYLQQFRELEAAQQSKKRPRAALREKLSSLKDDSGSAQGVETRQEPATPGEPESGAGDAQP